MNLNTISPNQSNSAMNPPNVIPMNPVPAHLNVRRLDPDDVSFTIGDHSRLDCAVDGEQTYRGVSAVLLFPISQPNRWVSLRYVDNADKEREIGVIEDLADYPLPEQDLVRSSLGRHYHEHRVEEILAVKQVYGQLFFTIRTTRGRVEFVTPWRQDRAEDWGETGKVILDALNNRYLIPNVNSLKPAEQRLLRTYIYW
jgi:ATP-binding cassette, subfamily B, bacterial